MFNFLVSLLKSLFSVIFRKRKDFIFTLLLLKKENEIMKRHLNLNRKRITSNNSDRFYLTLIEYYQNEQLTRGLAFLIWNLNRVTTP